MFKVFFLKGTFFTFNRLQQKSTKMSELNRKFDKLLKKKYF